MRYNATAMKMLVAAGLVIGAISNANAAYTCGLYMRSLFGITDSAYNMALKWAGFPHTSAQPGAVVVQTRRGKASDGKSPGGHVSKIVQIIDKCHAVVRDNRGTYKRDVCRNIVAFVIPPAQLGRRSAQSSRPVKHPRSRQAKEAKLSTIATLARD